MKYSAYATYEKEIYGKTTNPSDVANFNIVGVGNNAILSWDRPTSNIDLDVINGGYYRIRYTSELTSPTWSGATNIGGLVAGGSSTATVPLLAGSYLIKAYDSSGNESVNASYGKSNVATLMAMNAVHTCIEDPPFLGNHIDTSVQNNSLRLAEIPDIDYGLITAAVTSSLDYDDTGIDLNLETIPAEAQYDYGTTTAGARLVKILGYYEFNCNNVDLGQVYTSRVSTDIGLFTTDVGTTFDSASGLFDANSGKFDGGDIADADGELQIKTTIDDPASPSANWNDWNVFSVGDYYARGYKFRMKLWTTDPNHNVVIDKLRVTIDMPDRVDREYDLITSGGIKNVTFATAYKTRPSVGITAQDLESGDYWSLTNQTNTGFTVKFYDSLNQLYGTGGRPERTFNYMAVGY